MGYGNCKGCGDFDFCVGGLCVSCRRALPELEDDRPEEQRTCTCETDGRTKRILVIDSDCPLHGGEM